MISKSDLLLHYKRREIQEELVRAGENREVAARFGDDFGKRPDILKYPNDVIELVKQGATSFHVSEERWGNVLMLSTELGKKQLDELRTGWDLVLDIDCAILEYSQLAADLAVKALRHNDVENISVKFSGNKGFHIGVPFESFPKKIGGVDTKLMFPEHARRVAFYLTNLIEEPLEESLMKLEKDISGIARKTGKKPSEIINDKKRLDAKPFLKIDTILITSRHLYRMPYSFHEKSGLVSVPVNPKKILEFEKDEAKPRNVIVGEYRFMDRASSRTDDARKLFIQAFDFELPEEKVELRERKEYLAPEKAIPEVLFPDCIKKILNGLEDGRKRGLFILTNFLSSVGWDYEMIEKRVREWNQRNKEPLRENYVVAQLRYHKQRKKNILPPNCDNDMYYRDMRVKCADQVCSKCRNPVNCARRKAGL